MKNNIVLLVSLLMISFIPKIIGMEANDMQVLFPKNKTITIIDKNLESFQVASTIPLLMPPINYLVNKGADTIKFEDLTKIELNSLFNSLEKLAKQFGDQYVSNSLEKNPILQLFLLDELIINDRKYPTNEGYSIYGQNYMDSLLTQSTVLLSSPNNRYCIQSENRGFILDKNTNQLIPINEDYTSVKWSETGDYIALISNKAVKIFDLVDQKEILCVEEPHFYSFNQNFIWSPVNNDFTLCDKSGLTYYRIEKGQITKKENFYLPGVDSYSPSQDCWSPDGMYMTLCKDGYLMLFNFKDFNYYCLNNKEQIEAEEIKILWAKNSKFFAFCAESLLYMYEICDQGVITRHLSLSSDVDESCIEAPKVFIKIDNGFKNFMWTPDSKFFLFQNSYFIYSFETTNLNLNKFRKDRCFDLHYFKENKIIIRDFPNYDGICKIHIYDLITNSIQATISFKTPDAESYNKKAKIISLTDKLNLITPIPTSFIESVLKEIECTQNNIIKLDNPSVRTDYNCNIM